MKTSFHQCFEVPVAVDQVPFFVGPCMHHQVHTHSVYKVTTNQHFTICRLYQSMRILPLDQLVH